MALSFAIKLDDQVSPDARKAAGALQALHSQIQSEGVALKSLENQMRAVQRSGSVNLDVYKKLSSAIVDQKSKVAGLTDEMVRSGGAGFVPATVKARLLGFAMHELERNAGLSRRAIAAIGPEGLALAATLSGVALAGVAMAGGILGAAGAVVYLESKLISLGVTASEAKGDMVRSLELLYGSQSAADHTYKVLESLTGSIAISQERVLELADSLTKAGQVNGDAMIRSIETIGKAEAARKGAGKVLEGVITRATTNRIFSVSRTELMSVGLSYRELSKEVAKGIGTTTQEAELRLRTGGVRVKEGLEALGRVVDTKMGKLALQKFETVSVQTQRLHDNFMRLFEDVNAGPFARLLMVIANQLEESSVSGSALRTIVKSAFTEISAAAERVAPYVQAFFEGAILLALKFYNAMYPVRQSIAKMFGGDQKQGLDSFQDTLIKTANAVGIGFTAAGIAIAFMINNAGKLAEVVSSLISVTPLIGPAFDAARAAIAVATATLGAGSDKTNAAGKSVADGVAAGITSGTPAVEAAMRDMAAKGTKAFDDKMQIHSPSKVMQLRGHYVNLGLAKGVNDNADVPAAAMSKTGGALGEAPLAGKKTGGGVVVHVVFQQGAVVVGSGGSIAETEDQLTDLMANVFEKAAAMRGAG